MRRVAPSWTLLGAVGLLGFSAGALCVWLPGFSGHAEHARAASGIARGGQGFRGDELATIDLYERATRAIVFVTNARLDAPALDDLARRAGHGRGAPAPDWKAELHERWRERGPTIEVPGPDGKNAFALETAAFSNLLSWHNGSGFTWDEDGHVVTNAHVVENAFDLSVQLFDLSTWRASVVGLDPDKDLAVLKIDAPPEVLHTLELGRSSGLRVGQKAYSIGNPFGLSSTLTEGIVSALGRTIHSSAGEGAVIQDVIQTDAAINPGNSGGPLLDSSGRLIGVTTAIVTGDAGGAGIGFAIPVDTVNRVVTNLLRFGVPTRAGLGVRLLSERSALFEGVMIGHVLPGSTAEQAGLRQAYNPATRRYEKCGDVIVGVDGVGVREFADLYRVLDWKEPGETVVLAIAREGVQGVLDVPVVLQRIAQPKS